MEFQKFLADATNPLRLPDWRFSVINEYRINSPENIEIDPDEDFYIKTYLEFYKAYINARGSRIELLKLRRINPGLFDCYELGHLDNTHLRDIIDAFILTGMGFSAISEHVSVNPETLEWYEKIHFDVVDRLTKKIWLANYVLNCYKRKVISIYDTIKLSDDLKRKYSEEETTTVYKLCGLYGGPLVLEMMYTGFNSSTFPESSESVMPYINNMTQNFVKVRGAIAAKILSGREDNLISLINNAVQLTSSVQAEVKSEYTEQVQSAIKELKWNIGARDKMYIEDPTKLEPLVSDTLLMEQSPANTELLKQLEQFSIPQ